MVLLAGILMTLGVLIYVLAPLVNRVAAPLTDGPDSLAEIHELYTLRDVNYETLRDLEFDFRSGKISDADYSDLSHRFKREAIALVGRIENLERSIPQAGRSKRDG